MDVLHEINRHINISVLKYFVQETAIRTELGFTVVVPRGDDRCEKKTNNLVIIYNSNVWAQFRIAQFFSFRMKILSSNAWAMTGQTY